MSKQNPKNSQTCAHLGLGDLEIPEVVPLNEPFDGVPTVISTPRGLENAAKKLAAETGPVAIDTERASGIRYGQRAFLVQIKRGNSGIILIDPECFDDLKIINDALEDAEWVLHAATQDLPCLADLKMYPNALFDTEMASRLAGFERVGLGYIVELLLGYKLAKEHSAADWSKRPLPADWLNYAALDVEILLDLREAIIEVLKEQGKLEYAYQEFEYEREHPIREKKKEPWRKTKGIHQVRNRRQLTALRNLWAERDHLAQKKDIASKRLLPDSALIQAARTMPRTVPAMLQVPGFQTRSLKREAPRFVRAIAEARNDDSPVPYSTPSDAPPPVKAWETKRPVSAEILAEAKEAVNALADEMTVPHDNLLTPDTLRRLCWDPPRATSADISQALKKYGARPWQIEAVVPEILPIFEDHQDS